MGWPEHHGHGEARRIVSATQELLDAIKDHANKQADVADLYQTTLMFKVEFDAPAVNAAIIDRWSMSGLRHIKQLAWSGRPIAGVKA